MRDLTLRICCPADYAALRRLAERDTAAVPTGRLLAAEVDGRLIAAMSLETGAVIADPFLPTKDAVEILRRRVRQIRRAEGGPGLRLHKGLGRRAGRRTASAET
jgi:hypothetical protein